MAKTIKTFIAKSACVTKCLICFCVGCNSKLAQIKLNLAQMNVEKIKQIIDGGENATTEFKECIDKVSNSVYETVCSFLALI